MKKVEAQQARRVLDRIVGYQVSPFLWQPIRPGLSAGRVQTVALRLICEREDEIRAFVEQEYWSITAHLNHRDQAFEARLHKIEDKAFTLADETTTGAVVTDLEGVPFAVSEVKRRERRKMAAPPFTTSTLQQEAAKRLRFSARRTMTTAQRLYEGKDIGRRGTVGLITYMRTDSTRVSPEAAGAARDWIRDQFGAVYLPEIPQLYQTKKQKGAQEAHEAIRPADPTIHPDEVRPFLEDGEAQLYELIWLRFVASQMKPTVYDTTTVDFHLVGARSGRKLTFRATGSVVTFDGFARLYKEAREAGDLLRLDDMDPLPLLEVDDVPDLEKIESKQHFTQPPARFSEASLVKELERLGIGRPSTYASILSTLQDRGYVDLEDRRFFPTPLGDTVSKLLVRVFSDLFDVGFTSRMEGELDQVEEGERDWKELLGSFYPGLQRQLERGKDSVDAIVREISEAEGEVCEKCGSPMLVKWNKAGRFLGCSGYPGCRNTRSLYVPGEGAEDLALGVHPDEGKPVMVRSGPYGPYVQLGEAMGEGEKPRRVSLPQGVEPGAVTLDLAVKLLSLPRPLGADPSSGEDIEAGLGRYGPYIRRGRLFRNVKDLDHLFTISLAEACDIFAQEQGPAVLKELGDHPKSGAPLRVLDGRYGPYVTDGKVNASLPKGSDPADLTLEEALELLVKKAASAKRGGGRPPVRGRRKKG
jgi:DNA topoisomerase-1